MRILGGSFGEAQAMIKKPMFSNELELVVVAGVFGAAETIDLYSQLQSVEFQTSGEKTAIGGAALGAGVGALVAGPAGLVAGAILGGKKTEHTFTVLLRDGRSFLASGSADELKTMSGILANRNAGKAPFSVTAATPFPVPLALGALAVIAFLAFVVYYSYEPSSYVRLGPSQDFNAMRLQAAEEASNSTPKK